MSQLHSNAEVTRSTLSDESLITSKQLRELLGGCSEMQVWRLLNDEKNRALAFPKQIKINDRNYWRLGSVRQWVREREIQSQAASTGSLRAARRFKPAAPPYSSNSRKKIRSSKRARRHRVRASEARCYQPFKTKQRLKPVPTTVRRRP